MNGLLLHVGADTSNFETTGICGPIFEGGRFEFVPIREIKDTAENRTYDSLPSRNSENPLSVYFPGDLDKHHPHYDPDPEGFTYGEPPDARRGKVVSKLQQGDYLFFVSPLVACSLEGYSNRGRSAISRLQRHRMAKYVVGYYKIERVLKVSARSLPTLPLNDELKARVSQNAHCKRRTREDFVCVVGETEDRKSMLLTKAIQLTNAGRPFDPTEQGRLIYGDKRFGRGYKFLGEDSVRNLLRLISTSSN